jgi:hypothetical protein
MRYSLTAALLVAAWPANAFLPSSRSVPAKIFDSKLQMAFTTDKPSNMFDGPRALVKERDACGVGFIANIHSGGKLAAIAEDEPKTS